MKICIIGVGWVGCHLALTLSKHHQVTLISATGDVFDGTSRYNQNRLHLGYHYARSHNTRVLCKRTFDEFLSAYGNLTDVVNNNLYAVPSNESIIDADTYLKIFDDFDHQISSSKYLENISCAIQVRERHINPIKSKIFFKDKLSHLISQRHVNDSDLHQLSCEFDLIVNCTNNLLNSDSNNTFWEKCIMLVYEKTKPLDFDALTLVDGPFFSLYPYVDNKVTLSHVTYTPYDKSTTPTFTNTQLDLAHIRYKIEQDVLKYLPCFYDHFSYHDYFTSLKIKRNIKSDDRTPVVNTHNNIISCYTGKIQGIFNIQHIIENEISNRK